MALEVIAQMTQGKVISLDSQLAIDAGSFGVQHKLPLADSITYATTMKYDATLWTQGSDFNELPNVKFYAK